jgi:transmembrane sensor
MTPPPLSLVDDEAVGWFMALRDPDAPEQRFLEFRQWLESSSEHRDAYDRVETLWVALDPSKPDAPAVTVFQHRRAPARRAQTRRAAIWSGAGLAIAAGLAAVLVLPQMSAPPHLDTYRTAKGERREVTLADGSKLSLNSGTELSVQLGKTSRTVTLTAGEALFDVAHDASRPFSVVVGDQQIRDIGTAFNVLRRDDQLTVTVLRGVVAVDNRAGGQIAQLTQGDELRHRIGSSQSSQGRVDPQEAVAWRAGRLIYRDQSLSEVAADLNRYLPIPISVDAKAGALRFSGVLQLDREDVMIGRIVQLLPVRATSTTAAIRLSGRS